ncbi:conserved hypothetical protein [Verrucomicrobia bacterium]|nr:conserved hypothetical protein [Verrucomicrobiota bacterium]
MFAVEIDQPKKLVTISYMEHVDVAEAKTCAEQLRAAIAGLPSGFRVLVDMSRLDSMDLECAPYLEQMMDSCDDQGVGTVVRVIPDPHKDIGFGIMSAFHYRRSVNFVTCARLREALAVLAI